MSGSKEVQDAESIRSGNSHVTSRPVSFQPHPIPEGMLRHSFVSPSRRHRSRSRFIHPQWKIVIDQNEIKIRDTSLDRQPKFSHLQWRRLSKELWCRPTTTADFGSSFRQIPYTSHVCLLEDKVQDRGTYLFAISYGSAAMDQGSGVG